jgi:hypothetical protein
VSAGTHRLSEDDARWLARMTRVIHARAEALREREREHCPAEDESRPDAVDGDHDAA